MDTFRRHWVSWRKWSHVNPEIKPGIAANTFSLILKEPAFQETINEELGPNKEKSNNVGSMVSSIMSSPAFFLHPISTYLTHMCNAMTVWMLEYDLLPLLYDQ